MKFSELGHMAIFRVIFRLWLLNQSEKIQLWIYQPWRIDFFLRVCSFSIINMCFVIVVKDMVRRPRKSVMMVDSTSVVASLEPYWVARRIMFCTALGFGTSEVAWWSPLGFSNTFSWHIDQYDAGSLLWKMMSSTSPRIDLSSPTLHVAPFFRRLGLGCFFDSTPLYSPSIAHFFGGCLETHLRMRPS